MFFNRKSKDNTMYAFSIFPDGICFVIVEREANTKPRLIHWELVSCKEADRLTVLKGLAKHYKLAKKKCAFSLQSQDYRLLVVDAPPVPENEMVSAIKWDVQDIIENPVEETTFDIFPVPENSGHAKSLNVVAAKKASIVEIVDLLRKAKINISVIDIEELVLRNLVSTIGDDSKGLIGIFLHDTYGVIVFCKDSELYFSRYLDMGFNDLDMNQATLESLALEIQRSIDYFDRQFSSISMSSVLLMPSFDTSNHVAKFLNKNLSLSCSVFDLHEGIEWNVDSVKSSQSLILTLGTALRNEKAAK